MSNTENNTENNMKTIKLTKSELDKAFPNELLNMLEPESVMIIEQFKLKAMLLGVSKPEIDDVMMILK